jgi:nucleotide-binding universal stress UspA family protein
MRFAALDSDQALPTRVALRSLRAEAARSVRMSPIQSILLHIDAGDRSAVRMRIARELAQRHEAVVTAMFATRPRFVPLPNPFSEGMAVMPMLEETDPAQRARAKSLFDRDGEGMCWDEVVDAPPLPGFIRQALCADLLVLGQHDPQDRSTHDVPADLVTSVLFGSGKPALVIPHAGDPRTVGRCALVAWKAVPEAARALTAALPLLQSAARVHLVTPADEPPGGIELYLRRHNVDTAFHSIAAAPAQAGEQLLALARDLSADLLVMGCYGHSRARELVLGGATRTVLQAMTMPVLMAH